MSKLADQLNAHRIHNDHNLLSRFGVVGKTDVGVSYHRRPEGRMGVAQCNKTVVFSPSHKTDPSAHWTDYGCKSFIGNRVESFPKALAWASETYGIIEWDKSPFSSGGKLPKEVLDAAKAFLKTARQEIPA